MRILYLCGGSNPEGVRLALIINESRHRWDRIVVLDDDAGKHGKSILGTTIAGPFSMLGQADRNSSEVVNLVARTTHRRLSARRKIEPYRLDFATLVAPSVDITGVELPDDLTVYPNVSFCAHADVGQGCVFFTGAVIGHGCRIGRNCVVAPGAVINARVEVEEGVYIGTNASILPDLKIGAWATIGANSAVLQNVPDGATVMGVPAQVIIPGADAPAPASGAYLGSMGSSGNAGKSSVADTETLNELYSRLAEILNVPAVKATDRLQQFASWDSLALITTAALLATRFGLRINPPELNKVATVGELGKRVVQRPS